MTTFQDNRKNLEEAQRADYDNREMVREADHFLNKRDGQWEPDIITKFSNKPRYTFDECTPIVDDIMGEMESMDFGINVHPAGGEASIDTAQHYEGIIRNIELISCAKYIYKSAARIMVGTGLAGWRVVQAFRDGDSFQQDLLIKQIPNFQDNVFFSTGAVEQDMSDSDECWVLTSLTKSDYKDKYPKGSCMSVGDGRQVQVYSYKKSDEVVIGERLYKEKRQRELVLMSNGSVYVVDENFDNVRDEMFRLGIQVERTRKRDYFKVYQQIFDGSDWLTDKQETEFTEYLPIIPVFGNFRISENKVIYHGVVEKLMDAQRVINYSESRKIEEGALSGRGKVWMSKDYAKSSNVRNTLRTMNTNNDPVQFLDSPPEDNKNSFSPQYIPASESNPHLREVSVTAQDYIQRTSGTFDEARGTSTPGRSGTAIELLQNKSDNPKRKWFTSMEIAIGHTCRILLKAIPKVYDTRQEMRLINQDGTSDTVTIKDRVMDEQTGQVIEINDLSKGSYDVVCDAGPAFNNQQEKTVQSIIEIAGIDPSIIEIGADVLLNNISAPGIRKIAERKRALMLAQGLIPEDQMTDEEMQQMQAVNAQQQEPSAMDQALIAEAQARTEEVQAKTADTLSRIEERQQKFEIEAGKLALKQQEMMMKFQSETENRIITQFNSQYDQIKSMADTLKTLREAMGVDAVIGPGNTQAYKQQVKIVDKEQSELAGTSPN